MKIISLERTFNKTHSRDLTGGGNGVSSVSGAFPSEGNTFSAYLSRIRLSVSVFPVFPSIWRGGIA
jgi:hypothetical protein